MSLRTIVRRWSPRTEFWLILLLAFGHFVGTSIWAFLNHHTHVLSDRWAAVLVIHEMAVLALVGWMARMRGWSFRSLGLEASWRLTGGGILLYLGTIVATAVIYAMVALTLPGGVPRAALAIPARLSWVAVIALCTINPLFEELLVAGYIIRATSHHGPFFAISASALVRFLYHTYQGPVAAVTVLPLGLIFAAVYVRSRELWPLIVAHALFDLVALWPR